MKTHQVKIITGTRIKKDLEPEVNAFLAEIGATAEIVNISHSSYYDSENEDEVYSVLIYYKTDAVPVPVPAEKKKAVAGKAAAPKKKDKTPKAKKNTADQPS